MIEKYTYEMLNFEVKIIVIIAPRNLDMKNVFVSFYYFNAYSLDACVTGYFIYLFFLVLL